MQDVQTITLELEQNTAHNGNQNIKHCKYSACQNASVETELELMFQSNVLHQKRENSLLTIVETRFR